MLLFQMSISSAASSRLHGARYSWVCQELHSHTFKSAKHGMCSRSADGNVASEWRQHQLRAVLTYHCDVLCCAGNFCAT